jgi:hypothetical protein
MSMSNAHTHTHFLPPSSLPASAILFLSSTTLASIIKAWGLRNSRSKYAHQREEGEREDAKRENSEKESVKTLREDAKKGELRETRRKGTRKGNQNTRRKSMRRTLPGVLEKGSNTHMGRESMKREGTRKGNLNQKTR